MFFARREINEISRFSVYSFKRLAHFGRRHHGRSAQTQRGRNICLLVKSRELNVPKAHHLHGEMQLAFWIGLSAPNIVMLRTLTIRGSKNVAMGKRCFEFNGVLKGEMRNRQAAR